MISFYICVLLRIFKAHLKLEPAAAPHARAEHAGAWAAVDVNMVSHCRYSPWPRGCYDPWNEHTRPPHLAQNVPMKFTRFWIATQTTWGLPETPSLFFGGC